MEKYISPESDNADIAAALSSENGYFAQGRPAKHARGIIYRGPYEDLNDGVCLAVRRNAKAISVSEYEPGKTVPVFLKSFSYTMTSGGTRVWAKYDEIDKNVRDEIGDLTRCEIESPQLIVQHLTPHYQVLQNIMFPPYLGLPGVDPRWIERVRKTTIIYCAIERDRVSPEIAELLSMAAQVWVPCSWNRRALEDSGVGCSVKVVPHPVDRGDVFLGPRSRSPISGRPFRYLNVGKWEPRKDHHSLLGAFLLAHGPEDNYELILKCRAWGGGARWKGYPNTIDESMSHWINDESVRQRGWTADSVTKKVRIFGEMVDRQTLAKMYDACDAYVASGHAEGFDLPAFDAKLTGIGVIHVGKSGCADFCNQEQDTKIHTSEAECHRQYGWEPYSRWDGYTVQDLASAMKWHSSRAMSPREPVGKTFDVSDYFMEKIGSEMVGYMREAIDSIGGGFMEEIV